MQKSSQARQHIDRFLSEHHLRLCMNKVQRLRMNEVQHLRMDEVRHRTWGHRCDRLLTDAGIAKTKGLKQCGRGWTGTNPPGCKRAVPSEKDSTGKDTKSKESGSYSVVEDRDTLAKLTSAWEKKIKAYDAIVQVPKSEEVLKQIADYRKIIDQEFKGDESIPLTRLKMPIPISTQRQYGSISLNKKEALAMLDSIESRHEGEARIGKQRIKDSGIDPQKLNMERISDNRIIANLLLDLMNNKKERVIGVVSENGRLQSLLNWRQRKDSVYVNLLATAPENLDPGDPNRTKGGGTRAIAAAVRKSRAIGKDGVVTLTPLSGAESFYEGLGFKWKGSAEMILDKDAAEEVLRKYGKQ